MGKRAVRAEIIECNVFPDFIFTQVTPGYYLNALIAKRQMEYDMTHGLIIAVILQCFT